MSTLFPQKRKPQGAFTLIELLVVIAIISLLLALGAQPILGSMKASRLTGAGDKLLGALSDAQQTAFAQNYPVEVRFFKFPGAFGEEAIRSYQFYRISTVKTGTDPNTEAATKIGSLIKLPDNVFISPDPGLSPPLSGKAAVDTKVDAGLAGAKYTAIRFMTDGTCRKVDTDSTALASLTFLSLTDSFMTVVEDDGKTYTATDLPKNFYCVQVDPYTGKSRSYRPGF